VLRRLDRRRSTLRLKSTRISGKTSKVVKKMGANHHDLRLRQHRQHTSDVQVSAARVNVMAIRTSARRGHECRFFSKPETTASEERMPPQAHDASRDETIEMAAQNVGGCGLFH
jgi:hypothetical protein